MKITEVQIRPVQKREGSLKAVARVKFDDCFVVNDIKIVLTDKGYLVAMPSRKLLDGGFSDICHPLSKDMREYIDGKVMEAFRNAEDGRAA